MATRTFTKLGWAHGLVLALVTIATVTGTADVSAAPNSLPTVTYQPNSAAGTRASLEACVTSPSSTCVGSLRVAGATLPYHRTHPLGTPNAAITHAVVVIHGGQRNARANFDAITRAARDSGMLASAIVIAPQFTTLDDSPKPGGVYWSNSGWKQGDDSKSSHQLSSFAVVDRIIALLGDGARYPNLTHITVAGHSAGGQFVQRYAALSMGPDEVGVPVSFVVANPSSYLYLNEYRSADEGWSVPSTTCRYDNYRYGLQGGNAYMARVPRESIPARLTARAVTYLLGDLDTAQDADLDVGCGASLQGPNRFERGLTHYRHLDEFFAGHRHDLHTVQGVGHNEYRMFTSSIGRAVLFGEGHAPAAASPEADPVSGARNARDGARGDLPVVALPASPGDENAEAAPPPGDVEQDGHTAPAPTPQPDEGPPPSAEAPALDAPKATPAASAAPAPGSLAEFMEVLRFFGLATSS